MKKLLMLGLLLLVACGQSHKEASDSYIRDRVVKLIGKKGLFSGIQVKGESGTVYILSAGHCRILIEEGKTTAEYEDGTKKTVYFIAEDEKSDLMLLSAGNKDSIEIANRTNSHEHVHAITHGRGFPAYRTDGELLSISMTIIPIDMADTQEKFDECVKVPKYNVEMSMFGPICCMETKQMNSTTLVAPGSSGGALVNEAGQLVGITSATDGEFSTFVTLSDIHAFLADK